MTKEEVYNIVANKWRDNKGIGSIYAISPINSYELAVYIIKLMRNKNSNCKVFVLCYQYENYNVVRQYLNQSGLLESVTVVTTKYINPMYKYHYDICIAIGFSVLLANDVSIIEQLRHISDDIVFTVNDDTDISDVHGIGNAVFQIFIDIFFFALLPLVQIVSIDKDQTQH